jgi:protein-disulfide isomerase
MTGFAVLATIWILLGAITAAGPVEQAAGSTEQQQMLEELRAIRLLLQQGLARPPVAAADSPPKTARIAQLSGESLGRSSAPLVLVEFSDVQCPYCREFVLQTFGQIKSKWVDSGKLRYVVRDLPLSIHALAMNGARAQRCAGDQGKFWEMRTALFSRQADLTADAILKASSVAGLNAQQFTACYSNGVHEDEVRADLAEAQRLGLRGTPTFVIGRATGDSLDGKVIIGAQPFAVFDEYLQTLFNDERQQTER